MNGADLITGAPNRWCPGCGNFIIQHAFKDVLVQMAQEGFPIENVVIVTGIGQHGKMFDYMNVNAFYSIHGRTIPVATGITLSNPDLKVICFAGDGDAYAEGLDHTIFGAKRNVDITVFVHDNRVYGLTTGQYTPTSPAGFRGRSTPAGSVEFPLNPLELMLTSGATFVARAYTRKREQLTALMRQAIEHRGFSFVDILQICSSYYNMAGFYDAHIYDWDGKRIDDFMTAFVRAREWDYNSPDARIGLGVLYRKDAPTFGDRYLPTEMLKPEERDAKVREILLGRT